ncbi:ubiquitin carboxy-terminal hydrolase [Vairimorpha apis BRL 01]|uniref:Ubiquitin carboxy-terminal hydrolase n=1 Tax=Vairimorpha apis BRL 01 TaxID=1037528 RepID=T0LCM6_9MICR|nr:ubiquitin carboxy-terminal hydrolase [Vairimorpha apis BRL 01]
MSLVKYFLYVIEKEAVLCGDGEGCVDEIDLCVDEIEGMDNSECVNKRDLCVYDSGNMYCSVNRGDSNNLNISKFNSDNLNKNNSNIDAEKGVLFSDLPPVLFILLKRFSIDYENGECVKIGDLFEFDEVLDMSRYCVKSGGDDGLIDNGGDGVMSEGDEGMDCVDGNKECIDGGYDGKYEGSNINCIDKGVIDCGGDGGSVHKKGHLDCINTININTDNRKKSKGNNSSPSTLYNLYSVIVHKGTHEEGHFYTYIRPNINECANTNSDKSCNYPSHHSHNTSNNPSSNPTSNISNTLHNTSTSKSHTNPHNNNNTSHHSHNTLHNNPTSNSNKSTPHDPSHHSHNTLHNKWYKFNDEIVTPVSTQESIQNNYGGINPLTNQPKDFSAYYLVYINDPNLLTQPIKIKRTA